MESVYLYKSFITNNNCGWTGVVEKENLHKEKSMEIIYTHYDDCTPFRYNVHQLLLPVTKSLQSTKKINGTFSKWMQEPQE